MITKIFTISLFTTILTYANNLKNQIPPPISIPECMNIDTYIIDKYNIEYRIFDFILFLDKLQKLNTEPDDIYIFNEYCQFKNIICRNVNDLSSISDKLPKLVCDNNNQVINNINLIKYEIIKKYDEVNKIDYYLDDNYFDDYYFDNYYYFDDDYYFDDYYNTYYSIKKKN